MTHDFDRAAAVPIGHELSEATKQRHLLALSALTADTSPARGRSTFSRRLALVTAGILAAGGLGVGTAAALGAFSTPPADRNVAHCYTTADLDDPTNHNSFAVAVTADSDASTGDAATAAMETCSYWWAVGRFTPGVTTFPEHVDPGPTTHPVPPLVACVLDNGQVAIIPGDPATCERLGIPSALM